MPVRGEIVRNVIQINATSIDVTSSNTIAFGYVNELARAGRIIGGRHRLLRPLLDRSSQPQSSSRTESPKRRSKGTVLGGDVLSGNVSPRRSGNSTATGALASVWLADSLCHGTPVLVELLDPVIGEDPGLADLFISEARAASAVASPFVNRVLDFGIEHSTPYLVAEAPDAGTAGGTGETLAERIAGLRRPSPNELLRVFRDVALAVDAMHGLGLLHRDLRSHHVTLCRASTTPAAQPVAKLSFAISKLMNDTLELVRTMARRAVAPAATPLYASPEQVLGTATVGPQSDLWSLAVIAFEYATGELPFAGATLGEQLVQLCAGSPRVPSEVCSVPRGFDAWFRRGVQKVPAKRWSSAREMSDALGAVLSS